MKGLNPEQIQFYKDKGYLLVEDVLKPADLQPLIGEFNEVIDTWAHEYYKQGRLKDLFESEPFSRRLYKIYNAVERPDEIWRAVHGKNHKTAGMFALMTHPAILDIVESMIGPEILAHPQFNSRAKLPNHEATVVPWHQDLGYLQSDAEETFMVNFWIPLVDATVENGCMEVISGSHKHSLIPHEHISGYLGVPESKLPPGEIVPCPVRVGSVLLIQHKTIHRSIPNRSDHIRWSLDLRYSHPNLPTGRDNVPGFIARSVANPDSVAKSHLDWLKLFEGHH
ncbi:phytanoyl-CoA dioxygenase family protein [Candidatus Poribacteria bacterium]|nr:phytanoyl-CoA dioxygenase family protein [Candidatus Poribacteria bacterium]